MIPAKNLSLRKKRKLTEIFSVSIHYASQHLRSLLGPLLAYAIPVILVAYTASFIVTKSTNSLNRPLDYVNWLNDGDFAAYIAAYVIYVLGLCLFNLIINKHLLLSGGSEQALYFGDIKKDLAPNFRDNLLNFLIIFVIYFICDKLIKLMTEYFGGNTALYDQNATAILSKLLEVLLMVLPVLLTMGIALFFCFAALFVCYRDRMETREALKKVGGLVQKKPGQVILYSALLLLMAFIFQVSVQLLVFGLNTLIGSTAYNINVFFVAELVRVFFACFAAAYLQLAMLFLLGSLEDEAEGHSLLEQIDNL